MARVKSSRGAKHGKIRKATKGFKQARRRIIKAGKEALVHAGQYAYHGRKRKKRDLRKLWIIRLNAASRENGLKYSQLIAKLKSNKVTLDRKILSDIAATDPATFKTIISNLK